ncbi:MAG: PAS domain S-box protein [Bacteroidetes bacterium]|nr:PAS domain S-box protein [Bacteroidota bacterium]
MNDFFNNEVIHSPQTVLVVEDENIVALDLRSILTYLGYIVVGITGNGEEALSLIHSLKPDLVLMDIGLKGDKDGIDTAETIRKEMSTPIVFITANADSATLNRAKITEPYGFILKPFDEREIQTTLEMAFFRFKTDQELRENRQWLSTILQSIGDAVIATDEHGIIKFMNPNAEKLTGWSQSDAIGKKIQEVFVIFNESNRIPITNPIDIVLRDRTTVSLSNHIILIAKDGKEYNIDDVSAPIHDSKGEIVGVVVTFKDITEKHKAEALIDANERRYRALIENSSDMVRMIDATGKVLYISPATERIIGYSLEEYVGKSIFEFVHPDDLPIANQKLATILAHPESPINIQYRVIHKDGHTVWIEGIVRNLLHDPAVGAIVSNIRDITERKNVEQDLKENHAFLKAVTEGTDDIIFVKDISGKYLLCNTNGKKISGYTPEQMIGKTDAELFPAHVAEKAVEADRTVMETQKNLIIENTIDISGVIHTYMVSKNPLYDNDGKMIGVIGVARDITELKKVQGELIQKEELFRALIEGSSDGVILIRDGKIIYSSPANHKILGYSPEERQLKSFDELLHPDDAPKIRAMYQAMVNGEKETEKFEVRVQRKDGAWRWLEVNGRNMTNNPSVNAIVANFRDITDRKKAEQDLQENYSLLKSITEATDDVIFVKDTEGVYLFVNSSVEKTSVKTVGEIIGKTDDELFEKNEVELYKEVDNLVLSSEKGHTQEYSIKVAEQTYNFMTSKNPLYDSNQKLIGIVGISRDITNLKKAQSNLIKSEELFRAMIEDSNNGVVLLNEEGKILYSSPSNEKIIGYSAEERFEQDFIDIVHQDYTEKVINQFQRVKEKNGKNEPLEIQILHKDGSLFWLEISCRNMFDNPNVNAIVCNFHDITRRKEVAIELRKSEQNFQDIVEAITIPMVITNVKSRKILYCNQLVATMLGFSMDDLLKQKTLDFYANPGDRIKLILEMKNNRFVQNRPIQLKRINGELFWGLLTSHIIMFAGEEAVVTTVYDVTEQKLAEEKIKESEEKYRSLVENSPDIIMTLDLDYTIKFINYTVEGFTIEQVIGSNVFDYVSPHQHQKIKQVFENVRENKTMQHYELETPGLNGSVTWYFTYTIPIFSGEDVVGFTLITRDITNQKESEIELRKSELNFRNTVEAVTVPMIITALKTSKVLYANKLVADMMEVPLEDITTLNAIEYYHNADEREVYIKLLKEQGFVQNYLLQFKRRTGEILDVLASSRIITFDGQQALVSTLNDITDQKKAEESVRMSEERLSGVIESAMDGIITIDSNHIIILFNKSAELMFLCTAEEAIGTSIERFIPSQFRHTHSHSIAEFSESGVTNRTLGHLGVISGLRTNGEEFPLEASISQINTIKGKLFTIILRDITQRQKNIQQIKEQAALLDIVPDAIIVRELGGKVIFWNTEAEKIYGWSSTEAIGKSMINLIYKNETTDYYNVQQVLLETDEWSGELYQYTKTGEKILVRSRRKLVRNAQGEPIMVLIINTDITEQRKIEEQFLRAQRLDSIGTLASGIAHDLNNILTPVVLQMELLKIKLDDNASKQRINEIIGIIRRGSGLISQVLGFARGTKVESVAINPKYIISEVAKVIRETFPRDIEIHVNISKEDMSIQGDGTQLHQILMNLCINARDAMPTGGKLSIELALEKTDKNIIRQNGDDKLGQFALITVSDSGSGIPPEIQEKIFDPFFTTKEIGKGTGLGLATVYSIVKNHGGFVNVYSEVGNGTSFKIYLPAQVSVIDEIKEEIAIRQSGKKEIVLVVDDEELIRTITQDILEENGYVILTAQNGLEAAKIYQEKSDEISLVITDVMMPEMSGLDLIERIQKINPNARIIAASGMMQSDMAAKLLTMNISARLTKPFTADALLLAVHKALSK